MGHCRAGACGRNIMMVSRQQLLLLELSNKGAKGSAGSKGGSSREGNAASSGSTAESLGGVTWLL